MVTLYNENEEYKQFAKDSIKQHILELLDLNNGKISLSRLLTLMIHQENQYFKQKMRIDEILLELLRKGIISIKDNTIIKNYMTFLSEKGWKRITVEEFYEVKDKIKEKEMRLQSTLNANAILIQIEDMT